MPDAIAREALETYARFVAMRDEIDEGRRGWADLAGFFTQATTPATACSATATTCST